MSGTQKPFPGAYAKHFVAISYPLDWEKTLYFMRSNGTSTAADDGASPLGPARMSRVASLVLPILWGGWGGGAGRW